ncbi:PREDICTED: uncharacterized protein LOC109580592 [Amphimedon queenslandica]|uniref:Methyltransferase domain-containing protein n=1 Tax=Amphimedon queenslandica TaxID=400682 RepID=A0A1X7VEF1_AMPQE|nr:PREDICTED: uncharacterized protein LOC109580592 [Amphimedon queenslandica]|eukprot:XP_019849490.1 PREDICTED: uncharacterized protein LOC109580592 [Amphimedon queenslandica]
MAADAASSYHSLSDIQFKEGLTLIEELSPQEKDKVLDLGCGTGRLTQVLAERVGPEGLVVGIDPDEERIKVAIEEKGHGRSNLIFVVADDQSFPEDQYDMVFCSNVIHWIKEKERVFERVYKNLRPGGRFGFIAMHNFKEHDDLATEVIKLGSSQEVLDKLKSSFYYEPLEYYKKLAADYNFEIRHEVINEASYQFAGIDEFIEFLYGTLQGQFDKSSKNLKEIRKRYRPGDIINWPSPYLTLILTKP